MLDALPKTALFRFEAQVPFWDKPPMPGFPADAWEERHLAPLLSELNDGAAPCADLYWAWNFDGLHFLFHVTEPHGRPQVDTRQWWKKDGLRLCIHTRDLPDVRRATRFCHFLYILPTGGGRNGKQPIVGSHRMSRAKEPPPAIDESRIAVSADCTASEWLIQVYVPGTVLNGWDPAEHSRIGLFYKVKNHRAESQTLSVPDELGWNSDPSTWVTGVLSR